MTFDHTHRYAQQATRLTQGLFYVTTAMIVVGVVLALWQSWWWLLAVAAIVIFWALYSRFMPTVPVRDLATRTTATAKMADWRQFKQQYPGQVAKPGARD